MTIASEVKQCLASLKGAEAVLSSLAVRTMDEESQRIFHETMMTVHQAAEALQQRTGILETEETQYKGF